MKPLFPIVACLVLLVPPTVASAEEHGSEGHGASHGQHSDHGKHYAKGHHKFDSHDREVTQRWCEEHRHDLPVGFRPDDRLAPEIEVHLRVGNVLDAQLQQHVVPLPTDLMRLLPPPPTELRYAAIGGHVALLDAAHRLHDLLPLPPLPF